LRASTDGGREGSRAIDLAGVHAGPYLTARGRRVATDREGGAHGVAGACELDDVTITGLFDGSAAASTSSGVRPKS